MFDGKLVQRAAITGIALQVTMVVLAHYSVWVRANVSEFAAMMISGLAGLFYGRDYARGYARGALARNSAARARSIGWPSRRSADFFAHTSATSGRASHKGFVMPVSIAPGSR